MTNNSGQYCGETMEDLAKAIAENGPGVYQIKYNANEGNESHEWYYTVTVPEGAIVGGQISPNCGINFHNPDSQGLSRNEEIIGTINTGDQPTIDIAASCYLPGDREIVQNDPYGYGFVEHPATFLNEFTAQFGGQENHVGFSGFSSGGDASYKQALSYLEKNPGAPVVVYSVEPASDSIGGINSILESNADILNADNVLMIDIHNDALTDSMAIRPNGVHYFEINLDIQDITHEGQSIPYDGHGDANFEAILKSQFSDITSGEFDWNNLIKEFEYDGHKYKVGYTIFEHNADGTSSVKTKDDMNAYVACMMVKSEPEFIEVYLSKIKSMIDTLLSKQTVSPGSSTTQNPVSIIKYYNNLTSCIDVLCSKTTAEIQTINEVKGIYSDLDYHMSTEAAKLKGAFNEAVMSEKYDVPALNNPTTPASDMIPKTDIPENEAIGSGKKPGNPVSSGGGVSTSTNPSEQKPEEQKPGEQKPEEQKPGEQKPEEQKPKDETNLEDLPTSEENLPGKPTIEDPIKKNDKKPSSSGNGGGFYKPKPQKPTKTPNIPNPPKEETGEIIGPTLPEEPEIEIPTEIPNEPIIEIPDTEIIEPVTPIPQPTAAKSSNIGKTIGIAGAIGAAVGAAAYGAHQLTKNNDNPKADHYEYEDEDGSINNSDEIEYQEVENNDSNSLNDYV